MHMCVGTRGLHRLSARVQFFENVQWLLEEELLAVQGWE